MKKTRLSLFAAFAVLAFGACAQPSIAADKAAQQPTAQQQPAKPQPAPAANLNSPSAPAAVAVPPSAGQAQACPAGQVPGKTSCVPLVDVNAATADQIKADLAGFGPVFSQKVIEDRAKRGVFLGEDDFKNRMIAAGVAAANVEASLPQVMALPVLDANSATADDMKALLPGIGDGLAKRIVEARAKGPFLSKKEMIERATTAGVPAKTIESVAPVMALVDINKATADQMKAILPGIGDAYSKRIADPKNRPYADAEDLVRKGILPQATLDGLDGFIVAGKR